MVDKVVIDREKLERVADGVRHSSGTLEKLSLDQMAVLAMKVSNENENMSLGISGAQIGQIAEIAAVNDNGVPTEWKAMACPSNGETWEQIGLFTIEQDALNLEVNLGKDYKKLFIYANGSSLPLLQTGNKVVRLASTRYGYNTQIYAQNLSTDASSAWKDCRILIDFTICDRPLYMWSNTGSQIVTTGTVGTTSNGISHFYITSADGNAQFNERTWFIYGVPSK